MVAASVLVAIFGLPSAEFQAKTLAHSEYLLYEANSNISIFSKKTGLKIALMLQLDKKQNCVCLLATAYLSEQVSLLPSLQHGDRTNVPVG